MNIHTSCKEYAQLRKQKLKEIVESNPFSNFSLTVVQIDNDAASSSYIKGKQRDCDEIGVDFRHIQIHSDKVSQSDLEDLLLYECNEPVSGVILQLPIPSKYSVQDCVYWITKDKDVDGFRKDSEFNPCTPLGIINWLECNQVELEGTTVCVVGRSEIVGKPLVNMLIDKGATVVCCNSKTVNIKQYTQTCDIVISAIGQPEFFDSSYFSEDTKLIIDVGINRTKSGKLCGDVDTFDVELYYPNICVTPVPGGVGLLTRVALLDNIVKSTTKL